MPTKVGIHDFTARAMASRGWRAFARHDDGRRPRVETSGFWCYWTLAGGRHDPVLIPSLVDAPDYRQGRPDFNSAPRPGCGRRARAGSASRPTTSTTKPATENASPCRARPEGPRPTDDDVSGKGEQF